MADRVPVFIEGDHRQAFGQFYVILVGSDETVLESNVFGVPAINVYTDPKAAQEHGEQIEEDTTFKVVHFTDRDSLYEGVKGGIGKTFLNVRLNDEKAVVPAAEFFRWQMLREKKRLDRQKRQAKKAAKRGKGRHRSGKEIAAEELLRHKALAFASKGEIGISVNGRRFLVYAKPVHGKMHLCVDTIDDGGESIAFVTPTVHRSKWAYQINKVIGLAASFAHDLWRGAATAIQGEFYEKEPPPVPPQSWWRAEGHDFLTPEMALVVYPEAEPEEWRIGEVTDREVVVPYHTMCPVCRVRTVLAECTEPDCQMEEITALPEDDGEHVVKHEAKASQEDPEGPEAPATPDGADGAGDAG